MQVFSQVGAAGMILANVLPLVMSPLAQRHRQGSARRLKRQRRKKGVQGHLRGKPSAVSLLNAQVILPTPFFWEL